MNFQREYTAKQLNRGEAMTFHPISGFKLADLEFDVFGKRFYRSTPHPMRGSWGDWPDLCEYFLAITGGKKRYEVGEHYPSHWKFDPFTGQRLPPKPKRERCGRGRRKKLKN